MLIDITNFILGIVTQFGYLGILLIMIANSVFVPIPTEITLPFAGFLANLNQLSVTKVILVSILGELIGASITYSIGFFIGEKFINEFVKKRRKFLFINKENYERSSSWLRKHGFPVIFFAKLIPGLSTTTSLAAGVAEFKYPKFIIIQILASIVYNSTFVLAGFYLGSRWGKIIEIVQDFQIILFAFIVFSLVFWFLNRRLKIIKIPKLFNRF